MISKDNLFILIFSFIVGFFVSYEDKKYKLETYFGNNLKNFYQIETIHEFKKDNMIFDYAGTESFKVIIYTNNLEKAEEEAKEFVDNLNLKMLQKCNAILGLKLLDEYEIGCRNNRVLITKNEIYENKRFNYLKFILILLNLILILYFLKKIFLNIKKIN